MIARSTDIITLYILHKFQIDEEVLAQIPRKQRERKQEEQEEEQQATQEKSSFQAGPSTSIQAGPSAQVPRNPWPQWQQLLDAVVGLREHMQSMDQELDIMDVRLQYLERSWKEHHDPSSSD